MAAWPCPVLPILFQPSSTLSCLLPLCRMAALSIPATEAVAPAGDVAEQQDGGAPSGDASGDVRQAAARVVEALDPAQPQLRRHLSVLRATLEANQVLLLSFKLPVLDRRPSCLHTAAEIWSSCPTGSVPCWPSTQDAAQAPRPVPTQTAHEPLPRRLAGAAEAEDTEGHPRPAARPDGDPRNGIPHVRLKRLDSTNNMNHVLSIRSFRLLH